MVLRNKTYEHDANVETWQLCLVLRRSCEKNPVDWTRKSCKGQTTTMAQSTGSC